MSADSKSVDLDSLLTSASSALDALSEELQRESIDATRIDVAMLAYASAVQSIDITALSEDELERVQAAFAALAERNQQLLNSSGLLRDRFAAEFSTHRANQKGISAYNQQSGD